MQLEFRSKGFKKTDRFYALKYVSDINFKAGHSTTLKTFKLHIDPDIDTGLNGFSAYV